MVYIKHIVIPSFAMKDIFAIRTKLVEMVKKGLAKIEEEDDDSSAEQENEAPQSARDEFDASEFLFVAKRLAIKFPNLKESRIIRKFTTPLPKRTYRHLKDVSKPYGNSDDFIKDAAKMIVGFIAVSFVNLPSAVTDFTLQLSSATTFGYLIYGWLLMYTTFPIVGFGALVVIGFIIHFLICYGGSDSSLQPQNQNRDKATFRRSKGSKVGPDGMLTAPAGRSPNRVKVIPFPVDFSKDDLHDQNIVLDLAFEEEEDSGANSNSISSSSNSNSAWEDADEEAAERAFRDAEYVEDLFA